MTLIVLSKPRWFSGNDTHTRWNPDVVRSESPCGVDRASWLTRLVRWRICGKSPVDLFLRLNWGLWNRLPSSVTSLGLMRSYGDFLNLLARTRGLRGQAFSTYFLRNRPELELIRRLLEPKRNGETLKVAVLGCSTGAEAYSVAWRIRSARPDLKLILHAVDISKPAVEFAKQGVYSLRSAELTNTEIFDRMTMAEMEQLFDRNGDVAAVKSWIKEGIQWCVADAGEPETLDLRGAPGYGGGEQLSLPYGRSRGGEILTEHCPVGESRWVPLCFRDRLGCPDERLHLIWDGTRYRNCSRKFMTEILAARASGRAIMRVWSPSTGRGGIGESAMQQCFSQPMRRPHHLLSWRIDSR